MNIVLNNIHSQLIQWAKEQGVTVHGIAPAQIPGKGLGIIAERDIKLGECLISVPPAAMLTVNPTLVQPERNLPSGVSIHGRLAFAVAFPANADAVAPWLAIMPSRDDLRTSMPIFWPVMLQELLPVRAQTLLQKQRQKLDNDLSIVSKQVLVGRAVDKAVELEYLQAEYKYAWLLVNTRCFYWDYPVFRGDGLYARVHGSIKKAGRPLAKSKKWARDDCMAMCPVIDYFNHGDVDGCNVTYNEQGFSVFAERDHAAGEEMNFSYGSHSNDFLLVEYGFIMSPNLSDSIMLDEYIVPRLSPNMHGFLQDENLLGNYTLTPSTSLSTSICHRTQCGLRALQFTQARLRRFTSGATDGHEEQAAVDAALAELLGRFLIDVDDKLVALKKNSAAATDEGGSVGMLRNRWLQVQNIIRRVLAMAGVENR